MSLSPGMDPVLVNSPLFASLNDLEFNAVTAFLERQCFKAGDRIFTEGDHGKDMFVLLSGSLSAYKRQADGTQRWMFDIAPGFFLGEMSIIVHEPRSATITAREDADLMVLQGTDFYRIIFEHPLIGIKMLHAIGKIQNIWFAQASRHLKELVLWGEKARHRAITDELTGLYNRSFLEESLKDWFKLRAAKSRLLSLIMMDLDKVHDINDRYGQAGGDAVIVAVADILKTMRRTGDISVRLAGDEFAVLLPDTSAKNAIAVAERIRLKVMEQAVRIPGNPESLELRTRASMGIASAPRDAGNMRDLVFAADMALKKAKELGRNRVELHR
ncbi:MAG: GGDEF domain-containing protein [Treponema sp.]|jgi:diguanylate cyclase (GGDEF)-like protein|nr:GGDEF domain-containing protein [Treponema sp.]